MRRYVKATDDTEFERGPGLELLVETARLWLSLGHHDAEGCFRIDGVTGPDEYSALVDNNVFTNLMAARNLRVAADTATRYPQRAADLGVEAAEIEAWRNAAGNMVVPFDDELGVTSQSGGFTRYRHWDFAATPAEDYPLLLHYPYYLLYSSQVIKQADLVLALYLCGDAFSAEQKRRDFDYYEAITVRDSTLSASMQAIVAAETGRSAPRLRLLPRDGPRRSARSGRQHRGRPAPRLAGGRLAGCGGRASAACGTTARRSPSPRGFRPS